MKDRNGYILVYNKNHHRAEKNGIVYEHVLVAEKILDRELKKGEVVHHKDGNRSNNSPENLMIFATNGDHTSFHSGSEIYQIDGIWYSKRKRTKICPWCKKEFMLTKYDCYKRRKYCSHECARNANKKLKFSDNDISLLQKLIYENNGNISAVGRMLNVSGNAIVKRLKSHGLPYRSKDYM